MSARLEADVAVVGLGVVGQAEGVARGRHAPHLVRHGPRAAPGRVHDEVVPPAVPAHYHHPVVGAGGGVHRRHDGQAAGQRRVHRALQLAQAAHVAVRLVRDLIGVPVGAGVPLPIHVPAEHAGVDHVPGGVPARPHQQVHRHGCRGGLAGVFVLPEEGDPAQVGGGQPAGRGGGGGAGGARLDQRPPAQQLQQGRVLRAVPR